MTSNNDGKSVVGRSFGSFHSSNIDEQLKQAESGDYVPPDFLVDLKTFEMYRNSPPEFGKAIKKKHFLLTDDYTFLNHGAFGAALKDALETAQRVQTYVETQPVRFIDRELFPQIVRSHVRLAQFIGCKPSDFVFVQNATTGTNCILNSLQLSNKSVIYHLNTIYGAVKKSLNVVCQRTGAQTQVENLQFPLESKEAIINLVKNTLKPGTSIALFDHIASNMPFVMPIKELVQICHERNVPVCIDGAHALGQVPLDLHDIDADYYVTNAHKWFLCPKGAAVMYVKSKLQSSVRSMNVSHGHESGFHSEHTFNGLRDFSPYLALQCALNFWQSIGADIMRARMNVVLMEAIELLTGAWASFTMAPPQMHDYSSYFSINHETGIVSLLKSLDRENTSQVSLLIKAQQIDDREKFDVCLLVVEVDDVNDNQPIASLGNDHVTIDEHSKVGSLVTTVRTSDKDADTTFGYVISPPGILLVDNATGEIAVANSSLLDCETAESLEFEIYAVESNTPEGIRSDVINLRLDLDDVNDHSPVFNEKNITREFPENATVGSILFQVLATDDDSSDANSLVTYKFATPQQLFSISDSGVVRLIQALDAETKQLHQVVVVATDPGERSDICFVNIKLTGINEHPPVFTPFPSVINISKGTIASSLVAIAIATDSDVTSSVTYRLKNDDVIDGWFAIRDVSGMAEIRAAKDLSEADRDFHTLVVEASDGEYTTDTNLTIHLINDVNLPPIFNETFNFNLTENSPFNTTVGYLKAFDQDFGKNAEVEYHLCSADRFFNLDPVTGRISTRVTFDRETRSAHALCVYATDRGDPPLATPPINVQVVVLDENDNAPKFNRSDWLEAYHVPEDTAPYEIIRLKASDFDQPPIRHYFLLQNDFNGTFSLDNETGVLELVKSVDADQEGAALTFDLRVRVVDSDITSLKSDWESILVVVDDLNDNKPNFTQSHYDFTIAEDQPLSSVIGTVTSQDGDTSAANRRSLYEIESEYFSVNEYTGEIHLTRPLNYDPPENHRLLNATVSVRDESPGVTSFDMTSSASIAVYVTDANDNAPKFLEANAAIQEDGVVLKSLDRGDFGFYRLEVPENVTVGFLNVTMPFDDVDSGEAGRVKLNSSLSSLILVKENGELVLMAPLEYNPEDNEEWVTVSALDNGSPQKASSTLLLLKVIDVNQYGPKCSSDSYTFEIGVSWRPTIVGSISCTDEDNDTLTYNMNSLNETNDLHFNIDPITGIISVDSPSKPAYVTMTCYVTDGEHVTAVDVGVQILSETPRFEQDHYDVTLEEDLPTGSDVMQVNAAGCHSYHLAFLPSQLFEMNSSSGVLSLKQNRQLDFEKSEFHDVFVSCLQDGLNATATTVVRINVTDVNDNEPRFSDDVYEASVSENGAAGSVITQVFAGDEDSSSLLRFSIDTTLLDIDTYTGLITSAVVFDREERSNYSFIVSVTDEKHTNNATLRLNVLDQNDELPVFDVTSDNVTVTSGNLPALVYSAKASDGDLGVNASVLYRLRDSFGAFQIDPLDGEVFLQHYVTPSTYDVIIEARDLMANLENNSSSTDPDDVMTLYVTVMDDDIELDGPSTQQPTTSTFVTTSLDHVTSTAPFIGEPDVTLEGEGHPHLSLFNATDLNESIALNTTESTQTAQHTQHTTESTQHTNGPTTIVQHTTEPAQTTGYTQTTQQTQYTTETTQTVEHLTTQSYITNEATTFANLSTYGPGTTALTPVNTNNGTTPSTTLSAYDSTEVFSVIPTTNLATSSVTTNTPSPEKTTHFFDANPTTSNHGTEPYNDANFQTTPVVSTDATPTENTEINDFTSSYTSPTTLMEMSQTTTPTISPTPSTYDISGFVTTQEYGPPTSNAPHRTVEDDYTTSDVMSRNDNPRFNQNLYSVKFQNYIPSSQRILDLTVRNATPGLLYRIINPQNTPFYFPDSRYSDLVAVTPIFGPISFKLLVQVENACDKDKFDQATVEIVVSNSRNNTSHSHNKDLTFDIGIQPWKALEYVITPIFNDLQNYTLPLQSNFLEIHDPKTGSNSSIKVILENGNRINMFLHMTSRKHIFVAKIPSGGILEKKQLLGNLNACLMNSDAGIRINPSHPHNSGHESEKIKMFASTEEHEILDAVDAISLLKEHCSHELDASGIESLIADDLIDDDVHDGFKMTYVIVPLAVVCSCLVIALLVTSYYVMRGHSEPLVDSIESVSTKQPVCLYLGHSLNRFTSTDSDLDDDSSLVRSIPKRMKRKIDFGVGAGDGGSSGTSSWTPTIEVEQRAALPAFNTFKEVDKPKRLPAIQSHNPRNNASKTNSDDDFPPIPALGDCAIPTGSDVITRDDPNESGVQRLDDSKAENASVSVSSVSANCRVPDVVCDSIKSKNKVRVPLFSGGLDGALAPPVTDIDSFFVDYDIEALGVFPQGSTSF